MKSKKPWVRTKFGKFLYLEHRSRMGDVEKYLLSPQEAVRAKKRANKLL